MGPRCFFTCFDFRAGRGSNLSLCEIASRFASFRLTDVTCRELIGVEGSVAFVVLEEISRCFALDDIGSVTLTSSADLSILRFREWNKPLIRIRPAVQKALAKPRFRIVQRRVRGIPLSPMNSVFELHHRGGGSHLFFRGSGTGWRRVPAKSSPETLNPDSGKT